MGRSTLETNPKLSSALDVKVFSGLGSSKTPKFNETVLLGLVSPPPPFFFVFHSPLQYNQKKKSSYTQTFEEVTESCCPLLLFDIFKHSKIKLKKYRKAQKYRKPQKTAHVHFCSTLYYCYNSDLFLTEPIYPYVTCQFHFGERQPLPTTTKKHSK